MLTELYLKTAHQNLSFKAKKISAKLKEYKEKYLEALQNIIIDLLENC